MVGVRTRHLSDLCSLHCSFSDLSGLLISLPKLPIILQIPKFLRTARAGSSRAADLSSGDSSVWGRKSFVRTLFALLWKARLGGSDGGLLIRWNSSPL